MPINQVDGVVEFHGGPLDGERRVVDVDPPPKAVRISMPVQMTKRDGVPTVDFEETWKAKPTRCAHVTMYVYRTVE